MWFSHVSSDFDDDDDDDADADDDDDDADDDNDDDDNALLCHIIQKDLVLVKLMRGTIAHHEET